MRILQSLQRRQLSLAFYIMAMIGVLTIMATLYLSDVTRRTIQGSVESNQSWANRLATLTELQQAVVDLNVRAKASGKLDAMTVRVRRAHAQKNLNDILARLRSDLHDGLSPAEGRRVSDDLDEILAETNALIVDSDLALDGSQAGDPDGVSAATDAMDRRLSRIVAAAGRLQQSIQALQREAFAEQQLYLGDIQDFKYAFSAIVLVLVAASIYIGGRVSRLTREVDENRRGYLESLEARDRDLRLANERLEAAIAARTTELQVSEGKFRTLVGNIPGACYRCADDADYTMEFISDAIIDICGYPASDFIGNTARTYASIIHPDDLALVAELVGAGLAARRQYTIEYRVIHRNGSVRWVYEKGQGVFAADGTILHVDGAILDATESHKIREELTASEQKFKSLLTNIPGAIYRCAFDATYTIAFISDIIEDISGYPASDFVDNRVRSYASIIHPDDYAMVGEMTDETRTDSHRSSIEYRIIHRDGSVRWVYDRGQGVYGADGKLLHIDGAIFDITTRKDLETQLVDQKQMATLGQVAATVSHELRNPLGAIRNSMALVRQLTRDKQLGVERALDRVDRNIERCTVIISDLLDFTRRKELNRQPTAIDAWLAEMLAEHLLPDGVALERDLRANDEVAIDREKFRQVVVNLVDNAAQALKDPIWQPPEGHRRCIIVRTETAGPHVRLSVIDSGPGIAPDVIARIFEPLFTTKSFGVGLGLPTVRQIVEQHGGTINVESRINEGSSFTIWLPRGGETSSHPGEAASRNVAA
jgi:PAS domain S-box-containing protein